ncbi:MAG TPA: alpha-glucosidase C-terminal domain-containing protein, partial [Gemmatirosa sp.]
WKGPSLAGFYSRVFALKHAQPALANGAAGGDQRTLATNDPAHVYAYTRTRGGNTVLVAVNYGDVAADVAYEGLTRPGAYRDWFGRAGATLGGSGRLTVPAHGYRVLVQGS